jgi:hypothetical protein
VIGDIEQGGAGLEYGSVIGSHCSGERASPHGARGRRGSIPFASCPPTR